jgi:protein SCO1
VRVALVLALVASTASPALAQVARPPVLRGIGVEEHVGSQVPLDLPFTEAIARRVRLGDYFDGKRPVLLVLAYMRCKMLCSLVLQDATTAVRAMPLALGTDYRVVTVSIDPEDEAAAANEKRAELLRRAGHPGETEHWSFLLGGDRPIHELADTLGFHYRWDPTTEQFAHPAVLFVLTPTGKIARYLQGIDVAPATVAAALRDAGRGELSTVSLADTVLSCFNFDPAARAHREQIDAYLKIGGGVLTLVLGSAIAGLYLWERRRRVP